MKPYNLATTLKLIFSITLTFLFFAGISSGNASNLSQSISNTSPQQYVWDILEPGKPVLIDRDRTLSDIPDKYKGLDLLRTAHADRNSTGSSLISFNVTVPVHVYVAHVNKIKNKPSWLSDWVDTGDGFSSRSVYTKQFAPGTITLGGNKASSGDAGGMYLVMVSAAEAAENVQQDSGPLVLYTFNESSGSVVYDVSGIKPAINLQIKNTGNSRWLAGGGLAVDKPTLIYNSDPASKLVERVKATNEISIEAWIKPANTTQKGPARIISLSADPYARNFTLGQNRTTYDVRLRSTATDRNGLPALLSPDGILSTALTHVVYTRDAKGLATIYVNGVEQSRADLDGNLSNWDDIYRLGLANEQSEDRPWLGRYYRVAIYDYALSVSEVDSGYAAGPNVDSGLNDFSDSSSDTKDSIDSKIEPETGTTSLSWSAPTTRDDGDRLRLRDISGYTLYYGVTSGSYPNAIDIDDAFTTSVTVSDLPLGTYYFVVTARDTDGMESSPSNVRRKVVK